MKTKEACQEDGGKRHCSLFLAGWKLFQAGCIMFWSALLIHGLVGFSNMISV